MPGGGGPRRHGPRAMRSRRASAGLGGAVSVPPPPAPAARPGGGPAAGVLEAQRGVVSYPGGQQPATHARNAHDPGGTGRCARRQWAGGLLQGPCLAPPAPPPGRRVITHDEAAARAPAMTPRDAAGRHHQPRVERQLAESVRDPGGRRRRYRGQWRVQRPSRLTGLVVQVTRMGQRRRPQGAPPAWQPLSSPWRRGTAGAGAHGRRRTGLQSPRAR